jgi:hypothetical protein
MGQVLALGMEVVGLWHLGRLVLAPVHDQQLVPVRGQLLHDGGPDEPGPAQHHHPHPRSSRSGGRRRQPTGAATPVTAGTAQT